jgi:hypothetical protein
MSAQTFNANTFRLNSFAEAAQYRNGIFSGFPLRDSSDWVKLKKEISVYRESRPSFNPIRGNPSPLYSFRQSNQTRLTYALGRVGCNNCFYGPFSIKSIGV